MEDRFCSVTRMETSATTTRKRSFFLTIEFWIFVVVSCIGFLFTTYIYALDLMMVFVDQNSHLNIARQITDSLTPGVSQIGFWPPLLHIFMIPFAYIDVLFNTALAGAFTLIPIVALGAVFLYKLLFHLTKDTFVGIFGVGLFVLNPYLLYYMTTPMTEALFVSMLIITAYFLARWIESGSLLHLFLLSLFITLTSLSRFEGFLLLPIVGIIIAVKLFKEKKTISEIEGTGFLFGLVAALGIFLVLVYGIVYANDPLVFVNGPWSATVQQQFVDIPALGSISLSFSYMFEATKLLIGDNMVIMTLVASVFLCIVFFKQKQFLLFSGLCLVFISPFLFDTLALYWGSAVVYIEHLPPFEGFFNERYGLYSLPFVAFIIALLFDTFLKFSHISGRASYMGAAFFIVVLSMSYTFSFFTETATGGQPFRIIEISASEIQYDQKALAEVLRKEYDGGKILITRALQNFVTTETKISLRNYIHEANHPYYDEALDKPWFFARWIVTYNPDSLKTDAWRRQNEKIIARWANDPLFNEVYELVYENETERLYRLRVPLFETFLTGYGIDVKHIPSLNTELTKWSPVGVNAYLQEHFYKETYVFDTTAEQLQMLLALVPRVYK